MKSNSLASRFLTLTTLLLAMLFSGHSAQAASATWTGGSNNNWEAAGAENNWSTGAATFPGATGTLTNADVATFLSTGNATIAINSTAGNALGLNIGGITFGASAATPSAFIIGGATPNTGNSLLLSSGGTIQIATGALGAVTETINAPLVLEPASNITAGTYTFANNSSDAGSSLLVNSNITAGTTSNQITLSLAGATGSGTLTGTVNQLTATTAGGVIISKSGAGTWNFGASGGSGSSVLQKGQLLMTAGTFNFATTGTDTTSLSLQGNTTSGGNVGVYLQGGTFNMKGGTITTASTQQGLVVQGTGVYNQTGGLLNTGTDVIEFANNGTTTQNISGGELRTSNRIELNTNGTSSVTNLSGAGLITTPTLIMLSDQTNNGASTATFNLGTFSTNGSVLGGTLATGAIRHGTSTGTGNTIFNFDGGTLKATATNATFMNSNATAITSANLKSGGAIIDTNTFNIGISQALLHDSGLGATADGGVTKNGGTGTLTLTGTNTYTGATTISTGTLTTTNASGLGANAATNNVTLAVGTGLNYQAASNAQLLIGGTLGITSGSGTTIGSSIGSTGTSAEINVAGNATTTSGAVNVNIFGVNAAAPATGTYTLVHGAGGGSSLNNASYSLGTVYNNTNFTVGALSNTATDLQVGITSATALTTAFWKGGLTGNTNVWAASNGTSQSNFVATSGGANQALVPGSGADVTFSNSTVTTSAASTVLGADMTIKSLTINDATGLGVTADGYTLTIAPASSAVGITMGSTAGASTIGANVALGAAQTWTNNSANTLTVSGNVSGANSLTKAGTGALSLSGTNNSYSGGTFLNAGQLNFVSSTAIGTGTLTIAGGTSINGNGSGGTLTMTTTNAQTWNGDFTFTGVSSNLTFGTGAITLGAPVSNLTLTASANILTYGGAIGETNAGTAFTKAGAGTLTLSGANTYSGATTVNGGTMTLSGANGSILSSSGVAINGSGSKLFLDNSGTNNTNRIVNNVSLSLGGELSLTGNSGTDTTEAFGTLTFGAGNSTVTVTQGNAGRFATLSATSLARTAGTFGTGFVQGNTLGQASMQVGKIALGATPSGVNFVGAGGAGTGTGTTKNLSIVPWLTGSNVAASSTTVGKDFVTYDATLGSLRPLVAGEYDATTIAASSGGTNVKDTTTSETAIATKTVNSLFLAPAAAQTITGAGGGTNVLTISSGALASGVSAGLLGSTAFNSTISGFDSIAFGNGEAVVTVVQTGGTITLSSPISVTSSGGLTKAGAGTLTLTAANLYTGVTTINQGTLTIGNGTTGSLAGGSGAVTINNGTTLTINQPTLSTFANSIVQNGTISITNAGTETLSGNISGTGGITQATGSTTLALSGTNSYTGATTLSAGTLALNLASAINGSAITVSGTGVLTESATNALTGSTSLVVNAPVTLAQANNYTGTTNIGNTTLTLNNTGAVANSAVVDSGSSGSGTLQLRSNFDGDTFSAASVTLSKSLTIDVGQVSGSNTNKTLNLSAVTETGSQTINVTSSNAYSLGIGTLSATGGTATLNPTTGNLKIGTITGTNATTLGGTSTGNTIGAITTGSAGVTLNNTGTWTLTGASTYTGATNVSLSTLTLANTSSLGGTAVVVGTGATPTATAGNATLQVTGNSTIGSGATGSLTIKGGNTGGTPLGQGTLSLVDGTANTLTLSNSGTGVLLTLGNATVANPSILNLEVGSTADKIAITTGQLSTLGAVTVNITGIAALSGTQQTLISAGTSSGTNFVVDATHFVLGTTTGNFGGRTVSLANDSASAGTKLFLNETVASAGATAYWTGIASGLTGGTTAWNSFLNGNTNTSNFSTNSTGTANAAGLVDSTTDVTFNASANVTAGSFTSTTLGQDFTIKSLTFNSTTAVGIGGANTLTINGNAGNGITVATGAGNDTISSLIALGGNQTWTVTDSANTLTASNTISGAFNLTKAGAGKLTLSGSNSYSGTTTINAGTVAINSDSSLGAVPASPATNILFGGSGTLQDATNNVTLSANRNISIANGANATLDSLTNTFTVNGAIAAGTGTGITTLTLAGSGAGSTVLRGGISDAGTGGLLITQSSTGSVTYGGNGTSTLARSQVNINAGTFNFGSATDAPSLTINNLTSPQTGANVGLAVNNTANFNMVNGTINLGANTSQGLVLNGTNNTYTQTGGTYTTGGVIEFANSSSSAVSTVNISGGNLTTTASGAVRSTELAVRGTTTVTLSGTGVFTTPLLTMTTTQITGGTGGNGPASSTVNLGNGTVGGGTLVTGQIILGNNAFTGPGGTFNFNGGTLKSSASDTPAAAATTFMTGLTKANVQAGGAIVNTNGFNDTIAQPLLHDSALGATADGGLTKQGSGTLTLTGANTYTGATTISNGVLSVSSLANGGVASNLGQSTNAAANLVFDGGSLQYTGATVSTDRNFTINTSKTATVDVSTAGTNLTLAGASTSTNGNLTKQGLGTLTLTGTNLYTGTTTISGGTLQIGNGTTDGDIQTSSKIVDNAALIFNRAGSGFSYGGVISGSGTVTKTGAGMQTLSGTNTYTGVTFLNGGTLAIGADANLGDTVIHNDLNINNGATLETTAIFSSVRNINLGANGGNNPAAAPITNLSAIISVDPSTTLTLMGRILGTDPTSNLEVTSSSLVSGGLGDTGVLVLNNTAGTNAFSGGLYIHGGIVKTGNGPQFGDSVLTQDQGGTIISNQTGVFNAKSFIGTNGAVREAISGADVYRAGPIANVFGQTGGLTLQGDETAGGSAGKASLGGTNSFVGNVTVNTGFTLGISRDINLGNLANQLNLNGATLVIEDGAVNLGTGNPSTNVQATFATSRTINLTGAATIEVDNTYDTVAFDGSTAARTYPTANTLHTGTGTNPLVNVFTVNGVIAGAGSLTKTGVGTMVLTGANTYTGGTFLKGGMLTISADNNLGNTTTNAALSISNGAILDAAGTFSSSRQINLALNAGNVVGQPITNVSGIINVESGKTLTLTGPIRGLDLTSNLEVTGPGVLLLANTNASGPNSNAFSGGLYIHGSIVKTGNGPQFGDSVLTQDQGGVIISNQTGVFNAASYIGTGGAVREAISGADVYRGGPIANVSGQTGGLTLQGDQTAAFSAGKASLGGTNTFTGDVTVNTGFTLGISQDANLGNSANQLNLNGATLAVEDGANNTGGGGSSTAVQANFATNRTINLAGASTIQVNNDYDHVAFDASTTPRTYPTNAFGTHTNVFMENGVIGGGGSLNKTGAGTFVLTNSGNSYTGATTVTSGILQVNADHTLGTAAAGTTVASGANLALNNVNYSTAEALAINGTGISSGGALSNSGTSTYAGAITVTSNASIGSGTGSDSLTLTGGIDKNGTTLTFTGTGTVNVNSAITGALANSDLIVSGANVVLNSANSYNGPTTVNSGTLTAAVNTAISSTNLVTVQNGGTLLLTGTTTPGATPGGVSDRINNAAPISAGGGAGVAAIIGISGTGPVLEGTAVSTTNGGVSSTASSYATSSLTSVVGLGTLTLSSNSTLDFGSSTVGTLVFGGFTPGVFTLDITNYANVTYNGTSSGVDGTDDRLVFFGSQSANILANAFSFNGSTSSITQVALGDGFYEVGVSAVPEPATVFGGLALVGLVGFRERRRITALVSRLVA